MVLQITTGTDVGLGIRADLSTTDDLFVGLNGTVGSTDDIAVKGTGSGHHVEVQGTVIAEDEVIQLGDSLADFGQGLLIGEHGLVASVDAVGDNVAAVAIWGDGSTVDNRGTIRGYDKALNISADNPGLPITISNSGLIEAFSGGIIVFGGSPVEFSNSGEVRVSNPGGLTYWSFTAGTVDHIANSGLMVGNLSLGGSDDTYDARSGGRVIGQVGAGDGADKLYGGGFADVLRGEFDGDLLDGGGGNDTLDGGAAADTMFGRTGNDSYVVDAALDIVNETGGSGIDTVSSGIAFSLAASARVIGAFENLTLTGNGNINGTGNNLANTLIGNAVNNVLNGGLGNDILRGLNGNDTLIGGLGVDTLAGGGNHDFFVFNAPLAAANRDVIADFSHVDDAFELENAVMPTLGAQGASLNAAFFFAGAAAHDANDHVIYNKATGALIYDSNANAAGGTTLLATLANKPANVDASDFLVI